MDDTITTVSEVRTAIRGGVGTDMAGASAEYREEGGSGRERGRAGSRAQRVRCEV